MSISVLKRVGLAATGLSLLACASVQASSREPGWEAGVDVIYQDSTTLNFENGSKTEFDDDLGLALTFGYRVNAHVEVQFALDWSDVDYRATINLGAGGINTGNSTVEAFTPRVNVQFNLLEGPITPFLMGGIGYSFIDTNIPDGRPQSGCWWDPWYGYLCSTVQPTKSTEEFTYQVGVGGRFDLNDNFSLRLAYERHWIDINTADGTPALDQIKFGFSYRY